LAHLALISSAFVLNRALEPGHMSPDPD